MTNKIEKALLEMPYAQATVIITPERIALRSYETIVATIEDGWLAINGLYSMTTRRHIKAFCSEYAGFNNFDVIKMLVKDQMLYNIFTGEVIESF